MDSVLRESPLWEKRWLCIFENFPTLLWSLLASCLLSVVVQPTEGENSRWWMFFPSKNKVESNPLMKEKKDDLGLTSLQCEKPLVPKLWAPSVVSEGRQLRRGVMTWGFQKWLSWWQKNTLVSRVAFNKVGIRPGSTDLSKYRFTSPSCSHRRCRIGSYKPLSPAKPDQFVQ